MLAVFMQIMPVDKPTYYGESGTIARKGLNPGLGFRPQVNVESHLISYKPGSKNAQEHANNLQNFLDKCKMNRLVLLSYV